MIICRKAHTQTGKTSNIHVFPWETNEQAIIRINHTPHESAIEYIY